ncbi:hypothetical protein VNO80_25281 [Phaseolus coccineus]|uniref:Uncharacterized protein n=1 Tax=Phaseolus coccineus TaxID=3886 RepID=A0AAN9QT70_PHACN
MRHPILNSCKKTLFPLEKTALPMWLPKQKTKKTSTVFLASKTSTQGFNLHTPGSTPALSASICTHLILTLCNKTSSPTSTEDTLPFPARVSYKSDHLEKHIKQGPAI